VWFWLHPPLLLGLALFVGGKLWQTERYFTAGFAAEETMLALEAALQAGDREALEGLMDPRFSGWLPGGPPTRDRDGGEGWMGVACDGAPQAAAAWLAWADSLGEPLSLNLRAWDLQGWSGPRRLQVTLLLHAQGPLRQDRGRANMVLRRAGGSYRIAALHFPEPGSVQRSDEAPAFREAAAERGLRWNNLGGAAGSMTFGGASGVAGVGGGGGIGAGDFDNDGDTDLIFVGAATALFENLGGGQFRERPLHLERPDLVNGSGVAVTDFDNDGWLDLMLAHQKGDRAPQLYRGNGPFSWTNVTAERGPHIQVEKRTVNTVWADYDRDGDADCYALNFGDMASEPPDFLMDARNGVANQLFRNDGEAGFVDVSAEAGVGDVGFSLAGLWADVDGDGWLDLYSVNDYGSNRLYRNRGDGRFEDIGWSHGAVDHGPGMGAAWGDADGDGDGDLYVSNIELRNLWFYENKLQGWLGWRLFFDAATRAPLLEARDRMRHRLGLLPWQVSAQIADGNTLLMNQGDGHFRNEAGLRGVWQAGWSWGTAFADVDNDGDLDLAAASGFMTGSEPTDGYHHHMLMALKHPQRFQSGEFYSPEFIANRSWYGSEPNRLFLNDGAGYFRDRAFALGLTTTRDGRGLLPLDVDDDGDLDLVLANAGWHDPAASAAELYINEGPASGAWLQVHLQGTTSPRLPVGARLVVTTDRGSHSAWMTSNGSYLSSFAGPVHVGLGEATAVHHIDLLWPSGRHQRIEGPPIRACIRVIEDEGWELAGITARRR
jgi:hypothetical protein